tara:strand:- start:847 stop:1671 length:825 start_codon:yes stop_codon:yes gene_type:complete
LTCLCLIAFIAFACVAKNKRVKKRVARKSGSIFFKLPKKLAQTSSSLKTTPPSAYLMKLNPPSILNPKDNSEMVFINAGQYHLDSSGSQPETGRLEAFYIDRHEITIVQFKIFRPEYSVSPDREFPQFPATAIDWNNANRYCKWAGKRLPSQAEWEASARGPTGNIWPWGNNFSEDYANTFSTKDGFSGPAPVGSFPLGISIFGAADMIGNVWEWVSDEAFPPSGNKMKKLTKRIVKGGGWRSRKNETTIDFQNIVPADIKNPTFGFRCAKSAR